VRRISNWRTSHGNSTTAVHFQLYPWHWPIEGAVVRWLTYTGRTGSRALEDTCTPSCRACMCATLSQCSSSWLSCVRPLTIFVYWLNTREKYDKKVVVFFVYRFRPARRRALVATVDTWRSLCRLSTKKSRTGLSTRRWSSLYLHCGTSAVNLLRSLPVISDNLVFQWLIAMYNVFLFKWLTR